MGEVRGATAAEMRKLASEGAAALIADLEGFRESAYQDQAGVWTIGYGTTRIDGRKVQEGDVITRERAMQVLQAQILDFARQVDELVPKSIGQVAFDALVSFAYNVGISAFEKSTLLRFVVAGDVVAAADQFRRWSYAGGQVCEGLHKRRAIERALFVYGCAKQRDHVVDTFSWTGY